MFLLNSNSFTDCTSVRFQSGDCTPGKEPVGKSMCEVIYQTRDSVSSHVKHREES